MTEAAARLIERLVLGFLAAGGIGTAVGDNYVFQEDEQAGISYPLLITEYAECMVALSEHEEGEE